MYVLANGSTGLDIFFTRRVKMEEVRGGLRAAIRASMHCWFILWGIALTLAISPAALELRAAENGKEAHTPTPQEREALLKKVISNQHQDDVAVDLYEHIEHRQARKSAQDPVVIQSQAFRVFPTGTGSDKIPVQSDGQPIEPGAYVEELRKLEKMLLATLNPNSRAQRDAVAKYAKKQKDRAELVDAALQAFTFTWMGHEALGGQTYAKFHLDPNPAYKSTSRVTSIFSHVRATAWLDESTAQLARVDAEIFEDMPFGGGLVAKVYKGGRFILEQAEVAPGIWFPTLYDYNFEGRKFLFTMGAHVRTTLKQYRRVGPPDEALALIRAELNKMPLVLSDR